MYDVKHFLDPDLHFYEPEHKYFYGGKPLKSVTTLISEYKQPFDMNVVAEREAKKTGREVQEVIEEWNLQRELACSLGNSVHEEAEKIFNLPDGTCFRPPDGALGNFLWENPEVFSGFSIPEVQICHPDYNLAGTVDLLFSDGNAPAILDWKTNKSIEVIGYDKMLPPLNDLDDCNYTHYALQLNLYRWMLRERYDYDAERMLIVHLKGSGEYEEYEVPEMDEYLSKII